MANKDAFKLFILFKISLDWNYDQKKKSLKHKLKNVWYYSRYHGTCKDGNYYLKKKEIYRLNLTNNALKSIIPKEWFV